MNKGLQAIFRQSSSVTFIDGARDSGKTDFTLKIGEDCINLGIVDMMAGNIALHKLDPRFKYTCYFDDAEE